MDKRWRNMVILLVVVILIAAGYYLYTTGGLPGLNFFKKVSLDDGYGEILNIFENNDVNIVNVQFLDMVNLSNANKIVWVEKKESLTKVKLQLTDFSSKIASRAESKEVSDELSAVADLYVSAIDFGIKNEVYLTDLSKGASKEFSCSDLTFIDSIPAKADKMYADVEALSNKNADFILNYDLYSSPLLIDLDAEQKFVDFSKELVAQAHAYCLGGGTA